MNDSDELTAFIALNDEIKRRLSELDENISAYYPYFDYQKMAQNKADFTEILDQLLRLRCTFEVVKNSLQP